MVATGRFKALVGILGLCLLSLAVPSAAALAAPAGASLPTGRLNAVSCPVSPTFCFAAGDLSPTSSTDAPVLLQRNGTVWSQVSPVTPPGTESATFTGISCLSTGECFAVGNARTPTASGTPFIDLGWDHDNAFNLSTAPKSPTPESFLNAITCVSATDCLAVGDYFDDTSAQQKTMAQRWNGTAWAIVPTPNPKGARDSYLNALSCNVTGTVCTAVGYYVDGAGVEQTMSLRYSNLTFKLRLPPNPAGSTGNYLNGVACGTTGNCVAVGHSNNSSGVSLLVENWSAAGWAMGAPISPGPLGFFNGVSCKGPMDCTADGFYLNTSGPEVPLAESFNGVSWTMLAPVAPTGAQDTSLNAIDCTRPTVCVAMGFSNPAPPATGSNPFGGEFTGGLFRGFRF